MQTQALYTFMHKHTIFVHIVHVLYVHLCRLAHILSLLTKGRVTCIILT